MKDTVQLRASDSEEEVVGDKPPGQKRARRLEKELVVINAAVAKKEAEISKDIATFSERARIHKMTLEVEAERQRVEQERLDDDVMRMDLSLLDEDKIPYLQQRISEVYDRQAARVVQKAAGVAAANLAREAALVAEQEKELWEEERANNAMPSAERVSSASQGATPDAEDGDEDDTIVVPVVDLTQEVGRAYVNDAAEMERFTKMCEDMAAAIDERMGPEETTQPWLGEGEEWVQRTPEVSDTEAN